jgi:hypothetical protein
MAFVFPQSKIKAQLLLDEDIGRVSSKAVELIAACSALFVSDLVRGGDGQEDAPTPSASASCTKKHKQSSKAKPDVTNHPGPINLEYVQNCISKPEYEILGGVLDYLTENNAPKYDAAAKRRRRDKSAREKKSGVSKSANKKLTGQLIENKTINDGDDAFLNAAIEEAQGAPAGRRKEIVEDDDDYD